MKIQIRNKEAVIEGYVNAIERFSKPLKDTRGTFIEKIMPKVFERALEKNDNVLTLLNHDHNYVVANTKDGTAELYEDNIGLRAKITTSDEEIIKKAKKGKLRGWSFGFKANKEERHINDSGLEERTIRDLELIEVSILDDKKSPAYYGTSIEMRGEDTVVIEYRADETEVKVEDLTENKTEQQEEEKSLTYNERRELLSKEIHKILKDSYLSDFDDKYLYTSVFEQQVSKYYKIPYTINSVDNITIDITSKKEVRLQFVEVREDYNYKHKNRLNKLKMSY